MLKQLSKIFLLLSFCSLSYAYDTKTVVVKGHETPAEMKNVDVVEKPGDNLDLSLEFTDENSQLVSLGSLFKVNKPVLMTCLLYTSPSPRDATLSRMPSSA